MVVCPFGLFHLAIVLSVLPRFTDSDYLPLVSTNSSYTFLTIALYIQHGDLEGFLPL